MALSGIDRLLYIFVGAFIHKSCFDKQMFCKIIMILFKWNHLVLTIFMCVKFITETMNLSTDADSSTDKKNSKTPTIPQFILIFMEKKIKLKN